MAKNSIYDILKAIKDDEFFSLQNPMIPLVIVIIIAYLIVSFFP